MTQLRPVGAPVPAELPPFQPANPAAPQADPLLPKSVLHPLDQLLAQNGATGKPGKATSQLSLVETAWKENKELSTFLKQEIARLGLGDANATVMDLDKREIAQVRGTQAFYPASVIKVPVMAEAFHQASAGKISLDQKVTVRGANVVDTWQPPGDHRPLLHGGSTVTVRQLLELMISRSDNTATNTLIDLLGRKQISGFMKELGLPGIQVHRKLSVDSDPAADGRNTMTGTESARLLALIAEGELVDKDASATMLTILGGQLDNDKIPAGLPPGAKVYHKTGETSHTTHDSAIIDYKGKRYVLNVFTNLPPGAAQPRITELTKRLWAHPHFAAKP